MHRFVGSNKRTAERWKSSENSLTHGQAGYAENKLPFFYSSTGRFADDCTVKVHINPLGSTTIQCMYAFVTPSVVITIADVTLGECGCQMSSSTLRT